MRKTTVVQLSFLIIVGATLGASAERIRSAKSKNVKDFLVRETAETERARVESIETVRPRLSLGQKFGGNPITENGEDSNVKTSQRRYATAQNSARREPSIQAYGLPKRVVEDNGFIERVSFDRMSGLDGRVDKVNLQNGEPGIRAYGIPKRVVENNGFIERAGRNPDDREEPGFASGKMASIDENKSSIRRVRSVSGYEKNDLIDLEPQEAKVFRPLFVYRQQVADRNRVAPRKNSIYGAYQYGAKRQKNSIYGSRKYNY